MKALRRILFVSALLTTAASVRAGQFNTAYFEPRCEASDLITLKTKIEIVSRFTSLVRKTVEDGMESSIKDAFKNSLLEASSVNHESVNECDETESLRDWENCPITDVQVKYQEFARLCSSARGIDVIINGTIQNLSVPE